MTDTQQKMIHLHAVAYASKHGDRAPSANYNNRYNGYLQGYADGIASEQSEIGRAKVSSKKADKKAEHVPAMPLTHLEGPGIVMERETFDIGDFV